MEVWYSGGVCITDMPVVVRSNGIVLCSSGPTSSDPSRGQLELVVGWYWPCQG